jgi:hypothetical protein
VAGYCHCLNLWPGNDKRSFRIEKHKEHELALAKGTAIHNLLHITLPCHRCFLLVCKVKGWPTLISFFIGALLSRRTLTKQKEEDYLAFVLRT